MVKNLLFIVISFSFIFQKTTAQDVHFSQFSTTPTLLNPASAGSGKQSNAIINYRNQWKALSKPYTTFHAASDFALTKVNNTSGYLGAGIDITSDKAGSSEFSQLQAAISIAYHSHVGENSLLSGGIVLGYSQRTVNYNSLQWGSQFDGNTFNASLPGGDIGNNSVGFADIGAGLQWSYSKGERYMSGNDQRKIVLGISLLHLNKPGVSFYDSNEKLNQKVVFKGEMLFGIPNSALSVVPGLMYAQQGPQHETVLGTRVRYLLEQESNYTGFEKGKAISLGAHYRLGDAFITSVSLEIGKMDFYLSYDFTASDLKQSNNGRGATELGWRYLFVNANQKGSSKRY